MNNKDGNLIEINLVLPETDIKGLHFNETKVKALFELKNDGCYYSCDILFFSARQTDKVKDGDILTEYLEMLALKQAVCNALPTELKPDDASQIEVFIPEKNQGIKQYNGVTWWYWLRKPYAAASTGFCAISSFGIAHSTHASSVGGCAPAFRVAKQHQLQDTE